MFCVTEIGTYKPTGFQSPLQCSYRLNPSKAMIMAHKKIHCGINIISCSLTLFYDCLYDVYACIVFTKVPILYCNKVFELLTLNSVRAANCWNMQFIANMQSGVLLVDGFNEWNCCRICCAVVVCVEARHKKEKLKICCIVIIHTHSLKQRNTHTFMSETW